VPSQEWRKMEKGEQSRLNLGQGDDINRERVRGEIIPPFFILPFLS